ncbi:MAG: hypothetical protein AUI14_05505 [Actinobacteria bacterium 13_2_20CM_2_71_6]|nr:MAG: hypothetical protein AUI14_05505 [Actinobacteria bacterium 13_2_20CM_2_71_6]
MEPLRSDLQLFELAPTQEVQWEEMCADSPGDPGSSRNLVMDCRTFQGRLDRDRLEAAVAGVMRRHDSLRLIFEDPGLRPAMRIDDDVRPPLAWHSVQELGEPQRDEARNGILWRAFAKPFAATAEPLWRLTVVRTGPESHVLAALFSHVVADGYSCDVFYRDLVAYYTGADGDLRPAPRLRDILDRQERDYAVTPERLAYWRDQLGPCLERPALQPDLQPEHVDVLRREYTFFPLPEASVEGIRRTAWLARTTPFLTLLAAYHVTLTLLTGKRETAVVTSTTGRRNALDRAAVFQMARYPYVALAVDRDDTLVGLARRVHETIEVGIDSLIPYTDLAAAVNPDFAAARPWPDVNLIDGTLHSWPSGGDDIVAPGLIVTQIPNPVPPPSETIAGRRCAVPAAGDLPAELAGCRPGLTVSLERDRCVVFFNDQLWSAAAIERLRTTFVEVAGCFAAAPESTVGEVADAVQRTP